MNASMAPSRRGSNATDDEIRAHITALRARQRNAVIPSTRDEIDAEINQLLDRLSAQEVRPL